MTKLTMTPPAVVPDRALIASVIFTVPPQGGATIGESDNRALTSLQDEIRTRLAQPVLHSVYPHRVGRRSCLAVHLSDMHGKKLDILITVTGNTVWPGEGDYSSSVRWNICVPDATDMLWLLRGIEQATSGSLCQ